MTPSVEVPWIRLPVGLAGALCLVVACEPAVPVHEQVEVPSTDPSTAELALLAAPDSVWVSVDGPTLVAFHPNVSNDSLEADEDLATALDDLAYHISSAMDSLRAAGFSQEYRGGDTLWLRTGAQRALAVRDQDSASVGYLFADTGGRRMAVYGVRTSTELIAIAQEFLLTSNLRPRE